MKVVSFYTSFTAIDSDASSIAPDGATKETFAGGSATTDATSLRDWPEVVRDCLLYVTLDVFNKEFSHFNNIGR